MWTEFSSLSLLSSKDALSHWAGEENKPWSPKKSHFPLPWKVIALYSNWVLPPSAGQGWGFKLLQAQELTPRLKGGGYAQQINNLVTSIKLLNEVSYSGNFFTLLSQLCILFTQKALGTRYRSFGLLQTCGHLWGQYGHLCGQYGHLCHEVFIQISWRWKKTSLLQRLWGEGEREWDTYNK